MDGLVVGWVSGWMDGWMDRWVCEWMDGCVIYVKVISTLLSTSGGNICGLFLHKGWHFEHLLSVTEQTEKKRWTYLWTYCFFTYVLTNQ